MKDKKTLFDFENMLGYLSFPGQCMLVEAYNIPRPK